MSYLLEKIKRRKPRFSETNGKLIDRFSRKFGGTDKDKFEKGKFFGTNYECYLYATMLGIKNNYRAAGFRYSLHVGFRF